MTDMNTLLPTHQLADPRAGTGGAPIVSVIIPVYNCRDYIREALDSVLSQDFEDLEVLIANYRTRVSVDTGSVIDQQVQTRTARKSQAPATATTVEHLGPNAVTRRGWRHEVEISTTGPVTDLERIRKSHSERVAIVRAALIEGIPFR